jgi:transcriptional regulator with XRE-family HTH domain
MKRERSFEKNRIAELRHAAGLTLVTLANLVGTTPSTLSKLERSEIRLSVDWMTKLAPHLDVTPSDLVDWPGPPPVVPPPIVHRNELQVEFVNFQRAVVDACKIVVEAAEHFEIPPEDKSGLISQLVAPLAWLCLSPLDSARLPLSEWVIGTIMSATYPRKNASAQYNKKAHEMAREMLWEWVERQGTKD